MTKTAEQITENEKTQNLADQLKMFKEKTKTNFEDFYESYLPRLILYNNRIVRNMLIAEDIASDSFIKSLDKIDDYKPERAGFSTWLFTISRNECIQYINKHRRLTSIDRSLDMDGTTIKDFMEDDGHEIAEMRELENLNIKKGTILKEKIKLLRQPYRNVLELRELEKKSYRDITIVLREENTIDIDNSFFKKNYDHTTGILQLVDPEKRKPGDLIKFYTIEGISNDLGELVEYEIMERDKDNLISAIKIPVGVYGIHGQTPFNMSTLKSQIRNGRIMIRKMVKDEFDHLDKIYL